MYLEGRAPLKTSCFKAWRRTHLSDWKFAVMVSASVSGVVLLVNVIFYIVVASRAGFQDGQGYLYDGDCSKIRGINIGVHLVINILSTILIGASNYTMQILSAPTRKEVDRAHSRSIWLDIGIPSTRNLRSIGWKRVALWLILVLSSIPLHLL
jgi:hypothetical protein